jgi:putative DNA primase/helicase
MNNCISQFCRAIREAGLTSPDLIEADGKLHRFSSNGKRGDDSGWYVFYQDNIPAGRFGDWRSGISQTWRADIGRKLTPEEELQHRQRMKVRRSEHEAEEAKARADARGKACVIWGNAELATEHPYLTRKQIKPCGARVHNGALVVPMMEGGDVHSLQFIKPEGEKRFLTGGRVAGCYFSIGNPKGAAVLCIVEGFATGASVYEATGHPVAVAFNAGNLLAVAQTMKARFPEMLLVICADDDYQTEGNPGITKGREAAQAIGGKLAIPDFGSDRPEGATDFNDLASSAGLEAVLRCIGNATESEGGEGQPGTNDEPERDSAGNGWPDPHPMVAKIEPESYPLDALPDTIRAAVEEVSGFVKAPAALVASSALAALSLACQAHIDAKRAEKLHGPVGLFLLTIADSGERKSTCDGFFTSAIRQYQEEQAEAIKPAIKEYQAALAAWEAERDGILSAVKDAGKKGKPTDKLRGDLAQLQQEKPEPPRVPRLILGDETPENLAWSLAKQWPSAGVLSSEAGVVFGSHGMGKDSAMRNLALLNVLWDGGAHSIGRRTSESFTVRGARLTMGLMIQEITLREYFSKSGGLARGTGFLARFLVAWPESTQGKRPFTEAPANWPHLATFNRRIAAILNQPAPIDDDGALTPALLPLAPDAKAAWVEYHDAIEGELANGGELYNVRDVASKSADNAARLAALFQQFEHGMGGAVGLDSFERASRITAWHLSEARRFFGELALPAELADAARLDSWLIAYCKQEQAHVIGKNHVRQHGPLRDGGRLDNAIRELVELDRLRLEKDGKRLTIRLNPALVEVTA